MSESDLSVAKMIEEREEEKEDDDAPLEPTRSYLNIIRLSWFSISLNLCCTFLYGYALYFQHFNATAKKLNSILDPSIRMGGLWKFMTYHSLLMQLLSSGLHVISALVNKYCLTRDIVFTSLAYPIGSLVQYTFWTVWFSQGRDMIFPKSIETYYPSWLNHVTHTIVVPINIWQAYLTYHEYNRKGYLITIGFILAYGVFMLFIRWRAGMFVYPFMNQMNLASVIIYCASVLFCSLALYESGFFMTGVFHVKRTRRSMD